MKEEKEFCCRDFKFVYEQDVIVYKSACDGYYYIIENKGIHILSLRLNFCNFCGKKL